jgi:hypothetical protein
MKDEQVGEAIKIDCLPKFLQGEAIVNSLLACAPPMPPARESGDRSMNIEVLD